MRYSTNDMSQMMGIGNYVGEMRRGPDGQMYRWVEGVDGLGNLFGFWSKIKSVAGKVASAIPGVSQIKKIAQGFCSALPQIQPIVSLHPAIGPVAQIGTKVCGTLKKVGLLGVDGEIMQAPDGQHYEMVQGIGESGEPMTMLRPVQLIIPARIRTRRGGKRAPMTQAMPGTQAMPMTQTMPGAQAMPRPAAATPARTVYPVRRYR